ncbi:MAG: hypothetical protein ACOC11_01610 [Prolixibacteraceae bacterium]
MKKKSTLLFLIKKYQKENQPVMDQDEYSKRFFARAENGEMVPSEQTVNNILRFAQSYETMKTEKSGHVEMILN